MIDHDVENLLRQEADALISEPILREAFDKEIADVTSAVHEALAKQERFNGQGVIPNLPAEAKRTVRKWNENALAKIDYEFYEELMRDQKDPKKPYDFHSFKNNGYVNSDGRKQNLQIRENISAIRKMGIKVGSKVTYRGGKFEVTGFSNHGAVLIISADEKTFKSVNIFSIVKIS